MSDKVSVDRLKTVLRFEPASGLLFWRSRALHTFACGSHNQSRRAAQWEARFAERRAFTCVDAHGYLIGRVDYCALKAHRVAWALTHGEWPEHEIDHINGDRSDNRLINLRAATRSQNARNSALRKDNKSGVVGVSYCPREGKWIAKVFNRRIGGFSSKREAIEARRIAQLTEGFHPNHGRTQACRVERALTEGVRCK